MYVIDLFCGAGGFSEGIIQAGFHIVFSSDKSVHVKETYENRHKQLGLIQGKNTHFELADIRNLSGNKIFSCINNLEMFKENPLSEIDAIFGGPPCQGFSIAGKRDRTDPRNTLFKEYIRIISEIKPKYVVMENVEGFMSMELNDGFVGVSGAIYSNKILVSEVLQTELEILGYNVQIPKLLNASDYGVPQRRVRAIFIASRKDVFPASYPTPITKKLEDKVTVSEAIDDLSSGAISSYASSLRKGRTPHFNTGKTISNYGKILNNEMSRHNVAVVERFSLFRQGESIKHIADRILLNGLDLKEYPNLLLECTFNANKENNLQSLKRIIEKIKPEFFWEKEKKEKKLISLLKKIIKLWDCNDENKFNKEALKVSRDFNGDFSLSEDDFKQIFSECKRVWNTKYTEEYILNNFKNNPDVVADELLMESLLTKKNTRVRLDGNRVAPTMLTLPDDFIHPSLSRILTVREMARIQSFDDSFEFMGKRTTGGQKRQDEVPQYTQVGNAVPPLMAFAIASEIRKAINQTQKQKKNEKELIL